MPMRPMPAKNDATLFASMQGDHVAVRIPDFAAGKRWFVEKLDFRIVHEWRSDELRGRRSSPLALAGREGRNIAAGTGLLPLDFERRLALACRSTVKDGPPV